MSYFQNAANRISNSTHRNNDGIVDPSSLTTATRNAVALLVNIHRLFTIDYCSTKAKIKIHRFLLQIETSPPSHVTLALSLLGLLQLCLLGTRSGFKVYCRLVLAHTWIVAVQLSFPVCQVRSVPKKANAVQLGYPVFPRTH